jgi:ABC-2 type transport system permease protein
MNKILLIFQREYISRVFKKSFLLTTLLTPFAILLFVVIAGLIFSYDTDKEQTIIVSDPSELLSGELSSSKGLIFEFSNDDLESLKKRYDTASFSGILVVPPLDNIGTAEHTVYYYSDEKLSLESSNNITSKIRSKVRDYKIVQMGIDPAQLEMLSTRISLDPEPISPDTEDTSSMSTIIGSAIGGVMGYLMFFIILIYGMMVMRSVMEEKINRIVEIMISSVKPFQLMLGKILGVGAVGLTQILIWSILIPIFIWIANMIVGFSPNDIAELSQQPGVNLPPGMEDSFAYNYANAVEELKKINWLLIIPLFLLYFLGGYVIYTSLFAAVGSAIGDDLNEGNSLTAPLMLPIVFAVYIMFRVVALPNSSMAVWASIVPLTSPIVMPARFGADIPFWQIAVSVLVLVGFALFCVWIAAKIYRVGILLYGKKASFKELGKWIFSK